jgi:2'-5' RNA ligase
MIRTFIALPTTEEVQQRLGEVRRALERANAEVKWDDAAKYHITLRFIGDIDESLIPSLEESLHSNLIALKSFSYAFAGLGVFPNEREPKVVWAGVDDARYIAVLQSRVEQSCSMMGLSAERRPFHPHITLGRMKGPRNRARLIEGINTVTFERISAVCNSVQIIKSDLRPEGSHYTILKTITLPIQSE